MQKEIKKTINKKRNTGKPASKPNIPSNSSSPLAWAKEKRNSQSFLGFESAKVIDFVLSTKLNIIPFNSHIHTAKD